MKKNITIIFTLLLSGLFITQAQHKNKPNIIYILADDLGIGDVQSFNENGKIKTPNLDKLVSEGMKFTDAHTSSAVCTPTRYSIITGRYNWRSVMKNGVLKGRSKALIPNSRTTAASLLKDNGYETAYIGKWHLGWDWQSKKPLKKGADEVSFDNIDFTKPVKNNPNDLGFDYSYGLCGSLDMAPYVYVENRDVVEQPNRIHPEVKGYGSIRKGPVSPDFVHEQTMPHFFDKAIDYIKTKKKSKKPFFMYLPLPAPHTPILPTKEFKGKSGLNVYGDFVMMIDSYIGKFTDAIKKAGLEENTMIIFTSDNGCSNKANYGVLAEKGHNPSAVYRGRKTNIYEGGHRVPFIVKWPGKVKAGSVCDQTICTTDFLATCADIVDYTLKDNEGEDSYSMMPLLREEKIKGTYREATVHHSSKGDFAIRKGDWKLVLRVIKPKSDMEFLDKVKYELFNLATDMSEKKDVTKENSEVVKELHELMIKYIEDGRSTPGKVQKNDPVKEWKHRDVIIKG